MPEPRRRPPNAFLCGLLSSIVPGAGQIYAGRVRRGLVMLSVAAVAAGVAVVVSLRGSAYLLEQLVRPEILLALLAANFLFFVYRLFAVVDAYRLASRARRPTTRSAASAALATLSLAALVSLTAAPHIAAAYVNFASYEVLEAVFAEEEPQDVLGAADPWPLDETGGPVFLDDPVKARGLAPPSGRPASGESLAAARAKSRVGKTAGRTAKSRQEAWLRRLAGWKHAGGRWLNLLLLGGDAGFDRYGLRTDTMIVVSIQAGTGRAVAFGIPRNLERVRLPGEAGRVYGRFDGILNALYQFGQAHPDYFRGGRNPGATALKQTLAQLLGIPIHYYALVDLRGFVEIVDALGGVTVTATERVQDEVSPPYEGEEWIPIDLYPGERSHLDGRQALAYARSRWATSDYSRMRRQRCLLSAMAQQVSVRKVLRRFPKIASAVKTYVETDIPIRRVPDVVRLVARVDPARSFAESFGPPGYSVSSPDEDSIRATVRRMILTPPGRLRTRYGAETLRVACR